LCAKRSAVVNPFGDNDKKRETEIRLEKDKEKREERDLVQITTLGR